MEMSFGDTLPVPVLGNKLCQFIFEGYEEDQKKDDFYTAIANFLSIDKSELNAAAPHVFQYYKDCIAYWSPKDAKYIKIESPDTIWHYVRFGSEAIISRRSRNQEIYISLECGCDWEQEHGLQIVFKNGLKINKVGPFDGHLTNSDACGDERLENTIYHGG